MGAQPRAVPDRRRNGSVRGRTDRFPTPSRVQRRVRAALTASATTRVTGETRALHRFGLGAHGTDTAAVARVLLARHDRSQPASRSSCGSPTSTGRWPTAAPSPRHIRGSRASSCPASSKSKPDHTGRRGDSGGPPRDPPDGHRESGTERSPAGSVRHATRGGGDGGDHATGAVVRGRLRRRASSPQRPVRGRTSTSRSRTSGASSTCRRRSTRRSHS